MATMDLKLAEKMTKECKMGKRSTYCIVSYQDGPTWRYASCNNEAEYQSVVRSRVSGEKIETLWESPRFKDPEKRQRALAKEQRAQKFRDFLGL